MPALPHPRSHPRRGDRFRSMLAQWSLLSLLAAFLGFLCVIAAALAAAYYFFPDGDAHSYWFWLRQSVLLVSGLATSTTQGDESTTPRAIAQVAGALGALIIPALVLGTVVFKGFVKDRVFVTRSQLALLEPGDVDLDVEDVEYWLAFRVYSGTRLQLVNVRFEAYARVPARNPTKKKIVANVRLKLEKDHWPVALTHIPYTLYTPLRPGDIKWDGNAPRLVRVRDVNGNARDLTKGCDILLTVSGSIPELGTELLESHWFSGVDLTVGRFGEVEPEYPADLRTWKRSRSWPGWAGFDASERTFVFAYGSLLPRSDPGTPCVLRDHRRGWDVAMKNSVTVPGYKYYLDPASGERPDVFVAFLNIRPEPGSRVKGVAFEVEPRDIPGLDRRERNYARRDVTELIEIEGDLPGRVFAYIGTPAGRRRHARGVAAGTAVVTSEYLESVRAGLSSYDPGMLEEFDATTDPLDLPVVPLLRCDVGA